MELTLQALLSLPNGDYRVSSKSSVPHTIKLLESPRRHIKYNDNFFTPEVYMEIQDENMASLNTALAMFRPPQPPEYLEIHHQIYNHEPDINRIPDT